MDSKDVMEEALAEYLEEQMKRVQIRYSFITYNYTDILDQCIELTKEALTVNICRHQYGRQSGKKSM